MTRVLPILALASACSGAPEPAAVTWHQDVAPLVVNRCAGCHATGGIAPFPLETYEDARNVAPAVLAAVESRAMPPFLAQETDECAPRLPWQHDLRLSDAEIDLVRRWVDADAPEGDPASAAPAEPPQPVTLEREDLAVRLPAPITVDGVDDIHTCVVIDPGLAEDAYVVGRLITSGNERVLHHVVSYLALPGWNDDGTPMTKDQLEAAIRAERGVGIGERYDCFGGPGLETVETEIVDAWAPGALPNLAPPGSGQPMDRDALVILDVHYHPTGQGPEVDADTRLSLMLSDERPQYVSQVVLLGNFDERIDTDFGVGDLRLQAGESAAEFVIPAGEARHVEEMTWEWALTPGFELAVYGMGTHMHYVGRDMQVHLERADPQGSEPAEECLIQTPAWDFNWQRAYFYDAPQDRLPLMRDGDVLRMRCAYDNSTANPFLLDALIAQGLDEPVDVRLGEDTLDEMCLAAVAIMYPNFP